MEVEGYDARRWRDLLWLARPGTCRKLQDVTGGLCGGTGGVGGRHLLALSFGLWQRSTLCIIIIIIAL